MTTHWSEHMVKRKGQTRNVKNTELKKKLEVQVKSAQLPRGWVKLSLPGFAAKKP